MLGNPATKAHQVLNNNCNTQTVHVQSAIHVQVCIKTSTVPYMSMQCILVLSLHSLAHSLPGISICCWLGGQYLSLSPSSSTSNFSLLGKDLHRSSTS